MTSETANIRSVARSLRANMLMAIAASVLFIVGVLIWAGSAQIKQMSLVQIRHEGLLLSHTLEAALTAFAADGDVARIQSYIDTLVSKRDRNDMEINVLMLGAEESDIVASNLPDNIEEADDEEHVATLAALASGSPQLEVDREDGAEDINDDEPEDVDEDDDSEERAHDPSHPDYYFPAGSRLLSITTPLSHQGKSLGSINIKLSLAYLDTATAQLARHSLWTVAAGCLVLTLLLAPFLNRRLFRPLNNLAREMYAFGVGEEVGELAPSQRRDEIGVLENEFFNMVARIRSAELMRKELEQARADKVKHELEARLRQSQKMEALGTLAGGIAHDFNNLLTPIMGYAEMVKERLPGDASVQDDLGQVIQAGHRAHDLVRQILAFSRQSDEEKIPLPIGPVVKETLKLLRASIPANVEIRDDIAGSDSAVLGNPTQVHQIVLNLATNACHAMLERGGRLDVTLQNEMLAAENTQHLPAGHYVRLVVADTGHGIRPDIVERIFEPYFTTKKEGEGTGLGLAMVHGLVEGMGGSISVATELGKGTRFEVVLPVTDTASRLPDDKTNAPLPGGSERLLVVEDEESIARMLGSMLGSLGYQATFFTNPQTALDYVAADPSRFDLIVSDIAMPGMTGVEFAMQLSELGARIPIVLCSAYAGGINWRSAGALGIRQIVMKPINKAKLAQAIRSVLDSTEVALTS